MAQREIALRESIAKLSASALKAKKHLLRKKIQMPSIQPLEGLAGFEDDECKALAYQLGLRREIDASEADLSALEKLETRNLRAYGLAKVNQGLTDLKLRVVLNAKKFGNSNKGIEQLAGLDRRVSDLLDKELKLARAEAQRKSRDYQTWALTQLKAVPTFDVLLDVEFAKVASMVDRKNPLSKAHQDAEERAMNELGRIMNVRIAPINQALLDEAVATWYRKVFQDRFDKLSESHKLKVVIAFATTDKRSIEQ
ncbi:MAG: hypothetical protein IPO35_14370 [Uliginosibacterium sp.]|nr:hypothetical protein [Uliginosibacterium sp.]